ncbi:hypothetical protein [Bifidobacterium bohemicum]|nr:hypothetical protein [Bifidobacterium bohemicum]
MAQPEQPMGTLPVPTVLIALLIVSVALTLAMIVLTIFLSRPRKRRESYSHGMHTDINARHEWLERVQRTVDRFSQGVITRDEAFAELARTARDYAGERTGKDLSTRTLTDLNRGDGADGDTKALALLRQTISALYPPEFADVTRNMQARDTTVAEAGEWVSKLIERWRR